MRHRSCRRMTSGKQNSCVALHGIYLFTIPSTEVWTLLQVVRGLEQEQEVVRAQVLPAATPSGKAGGRFAFKRTAPAAPKVVDVVPRAAVPASGAPPSESSALSISDRTHEYLCAGDLLAEQLMEGVEHDVSLSNLSHCVVDFVSRPKNEGLGKIRALHARNVTRCILIMPIIDGSALLHEFKDCTLILGCHQVRETSSKWHRGLMRHSVSHAQLQ
jgi:Tubulin binding cofactor C